MLEIKDSLIKDAGLGVFATEDINEGTVLTEYYGKIFTLEAYLECTLDLSETKALLFWDGFYTLGNINEYDSKKCGQMINDYSMIENLEYTNAAFDNAVSLYEENSFAHSNVSILTRFSKHYIQSTKRINRGEELYFHYGLAYWIEFSGLSRQTDYINHIYNNLMFANNLRTSVLNFKKEKQSA